MSSLPLSHFLYNFNPPVLCLCAWGRGVRVRGCGLSLVRLFLLHHTQRSQSLSNWKAHSMELSPLGLLFGELCLFVCGFWKFLCTFLCMSVHM